MLPTILVTIISFLLDVSSTSPVYNLQPAHITGNIGSTGRNIRNLPCISRKTNQSGVCMFAIDCLKSNGTHLGTCIDRFYFGSCCHIEPLREISENTIDTALIPSREPPHRITTTTEKAIISNNATLINVTTTTAKPPKPSTNPPTTPATPAVAKTTPSAATKATEKPIKTSATVKPLVTKTTTVKTTTARASTVSASSASKKPDAESYKITTFQTVDDVPVTTTSVPTRRTTSRTTPKATTTIPRITKPRPQTTTTQKVAANATKTSSTGSTSSTSRPRPRPTKPISIKTTKPNTAKPILDNLNVKNATSAKPNIVTTTSTIKPVLTTVKSTTTQVASTLPTVESNDILGNVSNEKSNITINGNFATNEIELKPQTTSSTLVTWSEINKNDSLTSSTAAAAVTTTTTVKSTTVISANSSQNTSGEWQPVTDGWVLLPSVTIDDSTDQTTLSITDQPIIGLGLTNSSTESAESESSSTENLSSSSTEIDSSGSSESSSQSSSTQESSSEMEVSSVEAQSTSPMTPTSSASGVNMSDFTDVCGRRMVPEARIVGGEKSSFGKWPWQISLRQWRTSTYLHKCGAALLNENWAITAAHCVDSVPPSDLLLRLGEHDLSSEAEPYLHQERRVQIVASHPQFDPRTFEYDLALLRFYEPVRFQPNIIPVCVPQTDENFVGRNAFVTGWGRLYEDGPLPSILQEVSVPVINNTVCESMYRSAGYIEHIPHIFICAGWRRGGFDSCEGDSGGPMVIQRSDKRFLLAGVISWGIGCAEPNQPGVYTRISEFRDWINQILQF